MKSTHPALVAGSLNQLGTAAHRERQAVQLINMPGRWCLYGEIGQMSHELDAGGPLDAPEVMPSGSVNSVEWRNSAGQPIACQSEHRRDMMTLSATPRT